MTHTEVLDMILAHACPSTVAEDGTHTFLLSTHCQDVEVTARLLSTVDTIQYTILGAKTV